MSEFEDYAARIEAATIQLESEVAGITQYGTNLGDAVQDAEGYATDAQNAATEATQALQAFTSTNPLVKSRYGLVEAYTADLSVVSVEEASDLYGTVVYAEAGMTQVVLDAVPDASIAGFHFYVVNRSGSAVGVNSNTNTVNGGTVADQGFAIVLFNGSSYEFEVLSYGAGTGGGTGGDFDWTTIPTATESLKGLMSATDKTKLNSLQAYSVATESAEGLMSAADKTKLNGIAEGAEANVQSDFNATSGAALILNKPEVVYKGPLEYDPVYEEYAYNTALGTNGYMTPEYAVQLEELWTEYDAGNFTGGGGTGGGIEEAPADGQDYARRDGGWTAIELASVTTEVNPITEIPETVYTDGYMQGQDKENLDELWSGYSNGDFTGGGSGGLSDAPIDGELYARSDGGWEILEDASSSFDPVLETTVYKRGLLSADDKEALDDLVASGGGGGGGGATFPTYLDILQHGITPAAGNKWTILTIDSKALWDKMKTPAGLLELVYGVRDIRDVPFELGPVPVYCKNTYANRLTETPEAAPFATTNGTWFFVEARPFMGYMENLEVINADGGNVFVEVTHITSSSSDVLLNVPNTFAPGSRSYSIRKYINHTYSGKSGQSTPETTDVQWPFLWQVLEFSDATGAPQPRS